MWASIKKAINSNLKKPLNILTDELNNSLKDLINSKTDNANDFITNIVTNKEKVYEVSDAVLYEAEPIDLTWERNDDYLNLIGLFVPKYNGVIKLDITLRASKTTTGDKTHIMLIQETNTTGTNYSNDKCFYSLTDVGDTVRLPTNENFTTANPCVNKTLSGTTSKKYTILSNVKANIPLKIIVTTIRNVNVSYARTLYIEECKVYGEEVDY